jgi:hypothetical protein
VRLLRWAEAVNEGDEGLSAPKDIAWRRARLAATLRKRRFRMRLAPTSRAVATRRRPRFRRTIALSPVAAIVLVSVGLGGACGGKVIFDTGRAGATGGAPATGVTSTTSSPTVSGTSTGTDDSCDGIKSGACHSPGKLCTFGGTQCIEDFTCTMGVWQMSLSCGISSAAGG